MRVMGKLASLGLGLLLFACGDDSVTPGGAAPVGGSAEGGAEPAGGGGGAGGAPEGDCSGTQSGDPAMIGAMALLRATLEDQNIPGGAFIVVKEGEVLGLGVAGSKLVERCDPITADTLFGTAILTRLITSLATLDAVEDDLLDLDAPITDVVPGVYVAPNPHGTADDITLHTLLTATSGYRSAEDRWYVSGPCTTLQDVPNAEVPLLYAPPGSMHQIYQKSNAAIPGLALQIADQAPFADAARARVLEPLGMGGGFDSDVLSSGNYSLGHEAGFNTFLVTECRNTDPSLGYFGSANDMAKLFQYLTGGAGQVLDTPPLDPDGMLAPKGVNFYSSDYSAYGIDGWYVDQIDDDILYQFSNSFGFSAGAWLFRERRMAVVVLLNAYEGDPSPLIVGLPSMFDESLPEVFDFSADGPDQALLESAVGTFVDDVGLNGDGIARTLTLTFDPLRQPTELNAVLEGEDGTKQTLVFDGTGQSDDNFAVPLPSGSQLARAWRDSNGNVYAYTFAFDGGPPFYRVEE